MSVFARNKRIARTLVFTYKRTAQTLSFKLRPVLLYPLLLLPLMCACSAKGVAPQEAAPKENPPEKVKEEVRNYSNIACAGNESLKRGEDIASLASGYFIFDEGAKQRAFAQIKLQGQYATGQNEITSYSDFLPIIRQRLGLEDSKEGIKITSLVPLPSKVEKDKTLIFSRPCQIDNALAENVELQREPVLGKALYLLATEQNFALIRKGNYLHDHIIIKVRILNNDNQQVEEARFNFHEVMYWVTPDGQNKAQTEQIDENQGNQNESQAKWQLNKYLRYSGNSSFICYTVSKEGREGRIVSIEFVP